MILHFVDEMNDKVYTFAMTLVRNRKRHHAVSVIHIHPDDPVSPADAP